jgi:hypothetical protein
MIVGLTVLMSPALLAAPPATATLLSLDNGDVACYLKLKDEQGKSVSQMADFELCETGKALQGKKVALTYSTVRVMAASCQGDVNCKKTETRTLATRMVTVTAPAAGNAKAATIATSLCNANETVVFSCSTGVKMVSVCASPDLAPKKGTVSYRFGAPGAAPEMNITETPGPSSRTLYGQNEAFAGGGGTWLRFTRDAHEYVVYSGIGKWGKGGATAEKAGVSVSKDGKRITVVRCRGKDKGELGPDWFEKVGIASRQEEFLFPD